MFRKFWKKEETRSQNLKTAPVLEPIMVGVLAFKDDCVLNSGQVLSRFLSEKNFFSVSFHEKASVSSGYLENSNLMNGLEEKDIILRREKNDVIISGERQNDKIRLVFQSQGRYEEKVPFFSALNVLYLPLEYFQSEKIPDSVLNVITGIILSISRKIAWSLKKQLLQQCFNRINKSAIPTDLDIFCRPYILNALACVYMVSKRDSFGAADFKAALNLLQNAQDVDNKNQDRAFVGAVYFNMGQLCQMGLQNLTTEKFDLFRCAVENYRMAQKYLDRYNFPYDFAFFAYQMAQIYFQYWKKTSDIQALRDAVFQLREAEKIFTILHFPKLWAEIQLKLGFYLSIMGTLSKNAEISFLAIKNFQNRQSVFAKKTTPYEWAKAEESIGNIYYNLGKQRQNTADFEKAVEFYLSAAEVYENLNDQENLEKIQLCVTKSDERILALMSK